MKLKLLIIGLALLVSASPSFAGGIMMMGGGVAAAGTSYLLNPGDNFSGWTTDTSGGGTLDTAYATSPLVGSSSVDIYGSSGGGGPFLWSSYTAGSPRYAFFEVNFSALPTDDSALFQIQDSSGNIVARTIVTLGRVLRSYCTSSGTSGATTLSTGTNYYIWVEYTKGTGSNAVYRIYLSTTTTKPASPEIEISDGTATADAARIYFTSWYHGHYKLDYVIVDSSTIGSAP